MKESKLKKILIFFFKLINSEIKKTPCNIKKYSNELDTKLEIANKNIEEYKKESLVNSVIEVDVFISFLNRMNKTHKKEKEKLEKLKEEPLNEASLNDFLLSFIILDFINEEIHKNDIEINFRKIEIKNYINKIFLSKDLPSKIQLIKQTNNCINFALHIANAELLISLYSIRPFRIIDESNYIESLNEEKKYYEKSRNKIKNLIIYNDIN